MLITAILNSPSDNMSVSYVSLVLIVSLSLQNVLRCLLVCLVFLLKAGYAVSGNRN